MIFAKINPAPVSGSYITAMQATTNVGTESAPFNIHYGEVGFNKSGSVNQFNDSGSVKVTITGSILTKWGTDDAACPTNLGLLFISYYLYLIASSKIVTIIVVY